MTNKKEHRKIQKGVALEEERKRSLKEAKTVANEIKE